jgi:hypothetical protein
LIPASGSGHSTSFPAAWSVTTIAFMIIFSSFLSLCWICSSDNLRFYEEALPPLGAAAGRDTGAPGLPVDYGPSCYAVFLIDPDGNHVEASWMG